MTGRMRNAACGFNSGMSTVGLPAPADAADIFLESVRGTAPRLRTEGWASAAVLRDLTMASRPVDEKAVFNSTRRMPSPEERMAYLQEACGEDAGAQRRILELLRVYDQEQSFLESPLVAIGAPVDEPLIEKPGAVIGPYRLLEQVGEGGFGVVFLAEQTRPVRRKVALKVLKPGMDTRQVVARFEAERQALALMD